MQKYIYFGNVPEAILAKQNRNYRYYIPTIEEYIWVCEDCRLKYWESILLKKWKLVARESEGKQHCMACSEKESEIPFTIQAKDNMTIMLQEDLGHIKEKAQ